MTWFVAKRPSVAEQCDVNIQSINLGYPDHTCAELQSFKFLRTWGGKARLFGENRDNSSRREDDEPDKGMAKSMGSIVMGLNKTFRTSPEVDYQPQYIRTWSSYMTVHQMMRWLVVSAMLACAVRGDIFSSTAHLQNLLHLERHLVTTLHDYIDKTEAKVNQVKRYLNLFYDSYQEVLEEKLPGVVGGDEMVDHPLQAFQLVRRLAVDWDFVKRAMRSDDWNPVRRLISDYRQLMPNHDDLQGAAMALVRLQDTYKLSMSDMAKGSILGLLQGTKLSVARQPRVASVLQILVLKTRRSFSRPSIHLRFGLPFLRMPIG
ncbi:prolyl 4-hydroxylase subunit alpha-1 [Trichonephila clavipes]|nr:prolyl 4-hydroxylase subunit alpha-1 [Trichonephila clavipes]